MSVEKIVYSSSIYIFVTIADLTNDLLLINIGCAITARIRFANEILLSPIYRYLSVYKFGYKLIFIKFLV